MLCLGRSTLDHPLVPLVILMYADNLSSGSLDDSALRDAMGSFGMERRHRTSAAKVHRRLPSNIWPRAGILSKRVMREP